MSDRKLAGRASAVLAGQVERRAFLRNSASAIFLGGVAVSTGSVGISTFLSDPAFADNQGPCCPAGCGSSPCCDTSCCQTNGCCAYGQGNTAVCTNSSTTGCYGHDTRYYPTACWSDSDCGGHVC